MIERFYNEFATYYHLISMDRDFAGQVGLLRQLFERDQPNDRPYNLVELFAGPAIHCVAALQAGCAETWAIDSSETMKQVALEEGFAPACHYCVGTLPQDLHLIAENALLDCVLCLRYSLGYLEREEVVELLKLLATRLSPGGKIFIELHDISCVVGNMEGADILVRRAKSKTGEEVCCTWPDGPIKWDRLNFTAEMGVSLWVEHPDIPRKIERFSSRENIYSSKELAFMARLAGLKCTIADESFDDYAACKTYFPNSILIILSKKSL